MLRFSSLFVPVVAASGLVSWSASAAVTINSRLSEVTRVSWSNQSQSTTTVLGTSTALGSFSVPTYQTSNTTATGGTYAGVTDASGSSGPPAGSGRYGTYTRSRFEINFTVTGTADYTVTGSLQRFFNATSVLRLVRTTQNGSPTRTISAAGSASDNFAATPVNWTGTLIAGSYKLSIDDNGSEVLAGEPFQGTNSSFTFVIPAPASAAMFAACALPLAFRRRR